MAAVRRGAQAVLKYFIPLYILGVVIQIFLAGEGIFGAEGSPTEADESTTLDPHRGLGWFLTQPIAALLLIVALLAWHPVKPIRWWSIALPFILTLQIVLAELGRWGGAFHPLNAFFILGILGYLARQLWRPRSEPVAPA